MTVESEPEERGRRELAYLNGRVREEAEAAVRASSIEATLVHVALATAYARRLQALGSVNAS